MGEPKLPTGVRVRGNSLQIWFSWAGKRMHFETLSFEVTPGNIQRAGRLRAEIVQKIRWGAYHPADYNDVFRNRYAEAGEKAEVSRAVLFAEAAQSYLDGLEVAKVTRDSYRRSLQCYWMPHFAKLPVANITTAMIRKAIKANEFPTNKTRNNALISLRGVFKLLVIDQVILSDPSAPIENMRHQPKNVADPLTIEEIARVLGWMNREAPPTFFNFFDFALHSGLRNPSEMAGLHWETVDLASGYIIVDRKIAGKELLHETKTGVARRVVLPSTAIAALKRQRSITGLEDSYVFKTAHNRPLFSPEKTIKPLWRRCLRSLGIRHRDMRQTRHTCATQWIMAGLNDKFIAKQLGHSVMMLHKNYGRWLDEQGDAGEMAKLEGKTTHKLIK